MYGGVEGVGGWGGECPMSILSVTTCPSTTLGTDDEVVTPSAY